MILRDVNIREALLESGKKEFLAHGYEAASLRSICKGAGLTTGAFYNQFRSKEELFCAIVEPMLAEFDRLYGDVITKELTDLTTNIENELLSITYAIEHKEEFQLLFECARGTKYEGFKERLIYDFFYPGYQAVFDHYALRAVDPALVKIILRMKFEEYMELIFGGYSMEEVRRLITQISVFNVAGFHVLLQEMNKTN